MWGCSPWVLLPPGYSVFTAAGLWVVYFIAVNEDNIIPLTSPYRRRNGSFYAPYISNTGNFPPGSCFFSEMLNLAAFMGFVIAVLRYVQLRHTMDKPCLNVACLVMFAFSCFGMTLVGNFQLFSQMTIHNLGAIMTFGLGTLFCWLQSYITLKVDLGNEGTKVGIFRFLLSGSITICMILYFSLMAQRSHMHAARSQWAMVMLFLVFLGTFGIEFRHSRFSVACTDSSGHLVSTSET